MLNITARCMGVFCLGLEKHQCNTRNWNISLPADLEIASNCDHLQSENKHKLAELRKLDLTILNNYTAFKRKQLRSFSWILRSAIHERKERMPKFRCPLTRTTDKSLARQSYQPSTTKNRNEKQFLYSFTLS